ncbi:MAG: hypothetical protein K1060chlam5_01073 [Candidatus Anoxychlamydiales bacterium]|nr:hypothetical protein [Candidatus Anoxychlamydiales bacterium]
MFKIKNYKSILLLFLIFFSFGFSNKNIEYFSIKTSNYLCNQNIHVIEFDPNFFEIKLIKALDNGLGRESVLSIAKRSNAIAAINGGFFTIGTKYDGKACGTLKIHDWYSLPTKPRGCIGWNKKNEFIFDRLLVNIEGYYETFSFKIDGLNRQRNKTEVILFNSLFNKTTLTDIDGEEIIIENDVITEIIKNKSSNVIPHKGYILSIHKDHPLFNTFIIGSKIAFEFNILSQTDLTSSKDWEKREYILGGTPLLIYDNEKIIDFSSELTILSFLNNKHSRTAIGVLPNGRMIFIVVDKTSIYDGMTMYELLDLLCSFNCMYALNLDGGGSSTMVFENEIKNSPHGDEDEDKSKNITRRISDAIIINSK